MAFQSEATYDLKHLTDEPPSEKGPENVRESRTDEIASKNL
jgi:hypothetical protein